MKNIAKLIVITFSLLLVLPFLILLFDAVFEGYDSSVLGRLLESFD